MTMLTLGFFFSLFSFRTVTLNNFEMKKKTWKINGTKMYCVSSTTGLRSKSRRWSTATHKHALSLSLSFYHVISKAIIVESVITLSIIILFHHYYSFSLSSSFSFHFTSCVVCLFHLYLTLVCLFRIISCFFRWCRLCVCVCFLNINFYFFLSFQLAGLRIFNHNMYWENFA